jgi:hypothetical protein
MIPGDSTGIVPRGKNGGSPGEITQNDTRTLRDATPQTSQTVQGRDEIRAALVDLWMQIFINEIRALREVTVGTPGGVNRG